MKTTMILQRWDEGGGQYFQIMLDRDGNPVIIDEALERLALAQGNTVPPDEDGYVEVPLEWAVETGLLDE